MSAESRRVLKRMFYLLSIGSCVYTICTCLAELTAGELATKEPPGDLGAGARVEGTLGTTDLFTWRHQAAGALVAAGYPPRVVELLLELDSPTDQEANP